jgi:hypothetical protein
VPKAQSVHSTGNGAPEKFEYFPIKQSSQAFSPARYLCPGEQVTVGREDGMLEGTKVGSAVGAEDIVGIGEGDGEGNSDIEGTGDGSMVGLVGTGEGFSDGGKLGSGVGIAEGNAVGDTVGE